MYIGGPFLTVLDRDSHFQPTQKRYLEQGHSVLDALFTLLMWQLFPLFFKIKELVTISSSFGTSRTWNFFFAAVSGLLLFLKFKLSSPVLISVFNVLIPKDDSVRLLSHILEGLNYEKLYKAYSSTGRKPAVEWDKNRG
ncbi:hypothetical protein DP73_03030 [Desulfosporosinus sp. HMP52]|nr:hypothetical protein DP73_03030 [Desulfosporosinus sp. HMP52]